MIVKWMNVFGHRVSKDDPHKARELIHSLKYELNACSGDGSAESMKANSKTLGFAIDVLKDSIIPFYGLLIRRQNVSKHFYGDVDSGFDIEKTVRTNPRKHNIRHHECFYNKEDAIYGIILVSPPRDYKYREEVLSLQGIIKRYTLGCGLKIIEGGEEMIDECWNKD